MTNSSKEIDHGEVKLWAGLLTNPQLLLDN